MTLRVLRHIKKRRCLRVQISRLHVDLWNETATRLHETRVTLIGIASNQLTGLPDSAAAAAIDKLASASATAAAAAAVGCGD